jgi:hypothetical protein
MTSNGRMDLDDEMGMLWRELVVTSYKVLSYPSSCLGGLGKAMNTAG